MAYCSPRNEGDLEIIYLCRPETGPVFCKLEINVDFSVVARISEQRLSCWPHGYYVNPN